MGLNDLDKAKEIFMKFNGSHFQMERENEYQVYKKCNVSKKQELIWVKEIQNTLLSKMKKSNDITDLFIDLATIISDYDDLDGFKLMVKAASDYKDIDDSYLKVILAEQLISVVTTSKESNDSDKRLINEKAIRLAISILQSILDNPIVVCKKYLDLGYLDDVLKEEEIIRRVEEKILLCEKLLKKL